VDQANIFVRIWKFSQPRASFNVLASFRADPKIVTKNTTRNNPIKNIETTFFFPSFHVGFVRRSAISIWQVQAAVSALFAGKTISGYLIEISDRVETTKAIREELFHELQFGVNNLGIILQQQLTLFANRKPIHNEIPHLIINDLVGGNDLFPDKQFQDPSLVPQHKSIRIQL